jgi:hypothetical protein
MMMMSVKKKNTTKKMLAVVVVVARRFVKRGMRCASDVDDDADISWSLLAMTKPLPQHRPISNVSPESKKGDEEDNSSLLLL